MIQQVSKSLLRKHYREIRHNLTPQQQLQTSTSISKKLTQHKRIITAQHIALYLSYDGEVETSPIIAALWQQKKKVYLPVIHPFTKSHLLFLHYTPTTTMKKNSRGIMEPILNVQTVLPTHLLDIIIVPLVSFDKTGGRLGMGGGFYDRTLRNYQINNIYPIGIAHHDQQAKSIPQEEWDVKLPEIITPDQ